MHVNKFTISSSSYMKVFETDLLLLNIFLKHNLQQLLKFIKNAYKLQIQLILYHWKAISLLSIKNGPVLGHFGKFSRNRETCIFDHYFAFDFKLFWELLDFQVTSVSFYHFLSF